MNNVRMSDGIINSGVRGSASEGKDNGQRLSANGLSADHSAASSRLRHKYHEATVE